MSASLVARRAVAARREAMPYTEGGHDPNEPMRGLGFWVLGRFRAIVETTLLMLRPSCLYNPYTAINSSISIEHPNLNLPWVRSAVKPQPHKC